MIFFRRKWVDPRLRYDHLSNWTRIAVHPDFINKLWVPDIFFINERAAVVHEVTTPNMLIWLGLNGTVYMSVRLSLTLACPMLFARFPHETQLCRIDMESYAFTTDTLKLVWAEKTPLTVPKLLRMQQFYLASNKTEDCSEQAVYVTGRFPCLRVELSLKRFVAFYLMSTYVPTSFIVVLSWLSFWLDSDACAWPGDARCHYRPHNDDPELHIFTVTAEGTIRESTRRVDGYVHGVCVCSHHGVWFCQRPTPEGAGRIRAPRNRSRSRYQWPSK
ncbi:hypothetical protein NP493_890g02028 [Ridgeia piscesae]|uniref:Neurotransmitter-gated ion-channel ligand-binding domain-containing protein n=1 Tax=Ridgeia piscesae TaxID=27915 RepID=A0AAD9KMP0_RIDPI|nr:hypothetical protein NP493_890g02028 [Ridgeia piscesae]